MSIRVLRLDHRPVRDKRLTTHVLLAARALGADGATYTGERDPILEETIGDVISDWGGSFSVDFAEKWRRVVSAWRDEGGKVIHLTMYGLSLSESIDAIREDGADMLVVVGGPKVPGDLYDLVDWNVSVTSQPHSEVSALAIFLHELQEGRELSLSFKGGRLRVVPRGRGKRVERAGV